MKNQRLTLFALTAFTFLVNCFVFAQKGNKYHISTENGLQSNHIYGIMVDHNGHLWLGTPKGVVEYNGYECKTYTVRDGLSQDDIWQTKEDRKGRVWLGTISNELGYLYNGVYHKAVLKDIEGTIYPENISLRGDGIIFHSRYVNKTKVPVICIERNDTIYKISLPDSLNWSPNRLHNYKNPIVFINSEGKLYIFKNNFIYSANTKDTVLNIKRIATISDSLYWIKIKSDRITINGDQLIEFNPPHDQFSLKTLNLVNGNDTEITKESMTTDFNICGICQRSDVPGQIFVLTESEIIEMNSIKPNPKIKTIKINALLENNYILGSSISCFYRDKIWGDCVSTNSDGLFLNFDNKSQFKQESDSHFSKSTSAGAYRDSLYFRWNDITSELYIINKYNILNKFKIPNLKQIKSITQISDGRFVTFGPSFSSTTFLDINTGVAKKGIFGNDHFFGKGSCHTNDGTYYFYNNLGLQKGNLDTTIEKNTLVDPDRYNGLLYDNRTQRVYGHTTSKIFIGSKIHDTSIFVQNIKGGKIKIINNLIVDPHFGNIFLQCNEKIGIYNLTSNYFSELYKNYNFSESQIEIANDKLIVAGKFGMLVGKIVGKDKISPPCVYRNIKNHYYTQINDIQIINGRVLLNTDKGAYWVDLPNDSLFTINSIDSNYTLYKFLIYYNNIELNLKSGDSVRVDQNEKRIIFDLINPYGNGKLRYSFLPPGASDWKDLNANELSFPNVAPDEYLTYYVMAYDDAWRSDPIAITIYVTPHWWQKKMAIKLLWFGSIFGLLLLITGTALVSRRFVLRSNEKRNRRTELELKSIYAQINPHFIFNSLNSALLLVSKNQMDDAYIHIQKFARLLRGYLRSSRNKYITVDEEVKNLKNYVELQQVRFKDKFTYTINIQPEIIAQQLKIPSLLIQPLVENAINHGLLNKNEPGTLDIEFSIDETGKNIICNISDDGVGRKQSKIINEENVGKDESYGNLLIKDLIEAYNRFEHVQISLSYHDHEPPRTGTTVTLKIALSKIA